MRDKETREEKKDTAEQTKKKERRDITYKKKVL
jgi:hypothetical protein